ncbi:MAG: hypothetical protein K2Y39_22245 [Candidatus Obscuribacterales bacterium]|nr:hypothetical protein [Candidatus Obscuribacterales bacterium]
MSVIIPDPEDVNASNSALSAEIVAAMFDRPGYSPVIRQATREWIAEQRKNGYKDAPPQSSRQEWPLIAFIALVLGLAIFSLAHFCA